MNEIEKRIKYYPNGKKKSEGIYKDGKLDGLSTVWYENGHKEFEATWKDGEIDGLATGYHENGQKRSERIWKDGDVTTFNEWDEDGSLLYSKKFIL